MLNLILYSLLIVSTAPGIFASGQLPWTETQSQFAPVSSTNPYLQELIEKRELDPDDIESIKKDLENDFVPDNQREGTILIINNFYPQNVRPVDYTQNHLTCKTCNFEYSIDIEPRHTCTPNKYFTLLWQCPLQCSHISTNSAHLHSHLCYFCPNRLSYDHFMNSAQPIKITQVDRCQS